MKSARAKFIAVASLCAIGACSHPPESNLRRVWGDALKPYGLTPFYPMREDVHLGDIYLFVPAPCAGKSPPTVSEAVYLGALDIKSLAAAFKDYYGQRPVLPASFGDAGAQKAGRDASGAWQTPGKQPSAAIFPGATPPAVDRLRLAAFPGYSLGRYSQAELGAVAPVTGGLAAALGFSRKASQSVSVSLPVMEEESLPLTVFYRLVETYFKSAKAAQTIDPVALDFIIKKKEAEYPAPRGCTAARGKATVAFMSRIFYTRGIDFNFDNATSSAIIARAALTTQALKGAPPAFGENKNDGGAKDEPAASQMEKLQQAVAAQIAHLSTLNGTTPGVTASYGAGDYGGVKLNLTFDRPLAFGTEILFDYPLEDVLKRINYSTFQDRSAKDTIVAGEAGKEIDRDVFSRAFSLTIPRSDPVAPPRAD